MQSARGPAPNIPASVFGTFEHAINRLDIPLLAAHVGSTSAVQLTTDPGRALPTESHRVYLSNTADFAPWPRDKDHPVRRDALILPGSQVPPLNPCFRYQHPAQAVARRCTHPESKLHKSLLPLHHLCRKFPAVLLCHRAFESLQETAYEAAVIGKLLRAVVDRYSRFPTDELVMRRLVNILETSPATRSEERRVGKECRL